MLEEGKFIADRYEILAKAGAGFPLDLLCFIPLFYVRFRLPQLYLANMSPNFLIVFCITSLMIDLKKTFKFHTTSPVCDCLSF